MTTLTGEELISYLGKLEMEVSKLTNLQNKNTLSHLAHLQLAEVIKKEEDFLRQVYSSVTPVMGFSANGFPSAETLNADLEKMCELGDDFIQIRDRYQRDYFLEDNNSSNYHLKDMKKIGQKEFEKEETKLKKERTTRKIRFGLREVEGKLELGIKEETYLNNPDSFSLNFPLLTREKRNKFQIAWGRIFEEGEESFYVINKSLAFNEGIDDKRIKIKESFKEVGSSLYKNTPPFLAGFLSGHFMIPYFLQRERDFSLTFTRGGILPAGGHLVGLYPILLYTTLLIATDGIALPLFATQLTTNLLSGIYEIGRYKLLKKSENKKSEKIMEKDKSCRSHKDLLM